MTTAAAIDRLVYLGYLHLRYMFATTHPRVNSGLAICGSLAIVFTLLWLKSILPAEPVA